MPRAWVYSLEHLCTMLVEVQEGTGVCEKKGSGFGARVVHLYSYPALLLSEEGLPRGPSPF